MTAQSGIVQKFDILQLKLLSLLSWVQCLVCETYTNVHIPRNISETLFSKMVIAWQELYYDFTGTSETVETML